MEHLDLSHTITTKDMLTIFGVTSETTIWKWRKIGDLDDCVLSIQANDRHFIRFKLDCVLKWAKKTNHDTPGLAEWKRKNSGVSVSKKGTTQRKRVRVRA